MNQNSHQNRPGEEGFFRERRFVFQVSPEAPQGPEQPPQNENLPEWINPKNAKNFKRDTVQRMGNLLGPALQRLGNTNIQVERMRGQQNQQPSRPAGEPQNTNDQSRKEKVKQEIVSKLGMPTIDRYTIEEREAMKRKDQNSPNAKPSSDGTKVDESAAEGKVIGDTVEGAAKGGAPKGAGEAPKPNVPENTDAPPKPAEAGAKPKVAEGGEADNKPAEGPKTKAEMIKLFKDYLSQGGESLTDKEKEVLQKAIDAIIEKAEKLEPESLDDFQNQAMDLAEQEYQNNPEFQEVWDKMNPEEDPDKPLTEEEMKDVQRLLKDSTLKYAIEMTSDKDMQTSLSYMWIRGNGYDLRSDLEPTAENLQHPENFRVADGFGKFVNMIGFFLTMMRMAKDKMQGVTASPKGGKESGGTQPPEVSAESKIAKMNESQTGFKISLDKNELHIEPNSPKDAEFLDRVFEEHAELGYDGRIATGTNGAAFPLSLDKIDTLSSLISKEGRQKEEVVHTLNLKQGPDGTYTREGYEGTYTVLPNNTVYWSGGKNKSGNVLPPHICTFTPDGKEKWTPDTNPPLPNLENAPQFVQYLDTQLARAKGLPPAQREQIAQSLDTLAQGTDLQAKNLREQLQLAPSTNVTENQAKIATAQRFEGQSIALRKVATDIRALPKDKYEYVAQTTPSTPVAPKAAPAAAAEKPLTPAEKLAIQKLDVQITEKEIRVENLRKAKDGASRSAAGAKAMFPREEKELADLREQREKMVKGKKIA